MTDRRPDRELLERFVRGEAGPAERRSLVRHLISLAAGRRREDAAGAALDLALLAARQGRWDEVRRLAGDLAPLLAGRDVTQGTLAALLVLRRAVETEQVSISLLAELAGYLRRWGPERPVSTECLPRWAPR